MRRAAGSHVGHEGMLVRFILFMLFLAAAVAVWHWTPLGEVAQVSRMRDAVVSAGFGAPASFVALYALITVLLIPAWVMTLIGALLFGLWWGTIWCWLGALIGSSCAFLISRYLGHGFVQHLLGNSMAHAQELIRRHALRGVFIARLIPLVPYNLFNYAAGLTRASFRDYFWGSFLGMIPGTFIYMFLFTSIGGALLSGEWSWALLLQPSVIVSVLLFTLFALLPWVYHRLSGEHLHECLAKLK